MTSLAYMLMLPDRADLPRARGLLTEASDRGYAKAKSQLGFALLGGTLGETDATRAVELFREASEAGHVYATYALGRYGQGERRNAERRLRELAEDGMVDADRWLCEMRYETLDYRGIADHCEIAARHEYASAQAIWAGMLWQGAGVRRDDERALYWGERAITRLDRNITSEAALYDYTQLLISCIGDPDQDQCSQG